jgi:hypothetical protein
MPKLQLNALTWIWAISGCVAVISVLPWMGIRNDQGPWGAFLGVFGVLGFVGVVLSAMLTNMHDPNPVIAIFNWIIFAVVAIAVAKFKRRRKGEPAA